MSKYTIEKHGDGYAIYLGRDWQHHGANIGHLTEVTPATIKLIQDALNATLAQDHSDCGHEEYKPLCQMCMATKQKPWDTSDMAYRPNGLSMDQEPVAWMYPSDLKVFETDEATATAFSIKVGCPDEVSVPLYTAPVSKPQDIAVGIDVTELGTQLVVRRGNEIIKSEFYHAPKREWVSLTDEERIEAANNAGFGHINIALEIEAKLKEKNNG